MPHNRHAQLREWNCFRTLTLNQYSIDDPKEPEKITTQCYGTGRYFTDDTHVLCSGSPVCIHLTRQHLSMHRSAKIQAPPKAVDLLLSCEGL